MEHGHHQQLQYQQQEAQLAHLQQRYTSHPYNRAAAYIPNAQSMIHTPLYMLGLPLCTGIAICTGTVRGWKASSCTCCTDGSLGYVVASEPRACQLQPTASVASTAIARTKLTSSSTKHTALRLPTNKRQHNPRIQNPICTYVPTPPHHAQNVARLQPLSALGEAQEQGVTVAHRRCWVTRFHGARRSMVFRQVSNKCWAGSSGRATTARCTLANYQVARAWQ